MYTCTQNNFITLLDWNKPNLGFVLMYPCTHNNFITFWDENEPNLGFEEILYSYTLYSAQFWPCSKIWRLLASLYSYTHVLRTISLLFGIGMSQSSYDLYLWTLYPTRFWSCPKIWQISIFKHMLILAKWFVHLFYHWPLLALTKCYDTFRSLAQR